MVRIGHGALVISLDFELHWGVRDTFSGDTYRQNLLGEWEAIPRMLALFEEYDIAATWATVGFLFAKSRQNLEEFSPSVKPLYAEPLLSSYQEPIGESEVDDPLHFAPSLIEAIRRTPRQELATHTFSHLYCLEPGQDREAFQADLGSALAIAGENGVRIRSIVFPKNQHNPDYDDLLIDAGIVCYRGNHHAWMHRDPVMYRVPDAVGQRQLKRAARLLDTYTSLAGPHTVSWETIRQSNGLCNIPESFFLKPYSPRWRRLEPLRLQRIVKSIKRAAVRQEVLHLWWHPHNFGINIDQNLDFLRRILEVFCRYRDDHGMRSMSMADAAAAVRENNE
jgi:peptidoglycan/xylan/chitin deacetylase (PgdA/CDA1 family)